MAVAMIVAVGTPNSICPTFGVKGLVDVADLPTQQLDHMFNHMIARNHKPVVFNLTRGMAIANMPGKLQQVVTNNSNQGFASRLNFNRLSIR